LQPQGNKSTLCGEVACSLHVYMSSLSDYSALEKET